MPASSLSLRPHPGHRHPRRLDADRPGIEAARVLRDLGMPDDRIVASFVTAGMSPSHAADMVRSLHHADGPRAGLPPLRCERAGVVRAVR